MKRKNVFHGFMAAAICVMLLLTNIILIDTAETALAAGKNISSLTISGIDATEYTGEKVALKPVLKDGKKTLKNGTDYSLSYKNNLEIGNATVTIKGKGSYAGSITKSFQIIPPKVQGLTAKSVVTGTVELTWILDYGQVLSGFEVFYATGKDGKYTMLEAVNTNACKAKLTVGKTYYAKVRAYAKVDQKTYYGKFSEVVKVSVLKEQSKINIIDSGRAYGNYIKLSEIPEEIVKQMKFIYPEGILTELSIQYLDKDTNSGRWANFFEEVSEDNNLEMGKNEYVGMFRFNILTKESVDTVQPYYEAMKPDEHKEWYSNNMNNPVLNYKRSGGTGIYSISLNKNPAVDSDGWIQEYMDMKEDGYITMIYGYSEWLPK